MNIHNLQSAQSKMKTLTIDTEVDVAYAALAAKKYAEDIGFSKTSQYMISTAVSELARNIFIYAKNGTINLKSVHHSSRTGIEVIAEDSGPGIRNLEAAMKDKFSTGGTMGIGLPGTRRLMDDFQIEGGRKCGTKVTVLKWI